MEKPLVSVCIITYNSAKTIVDTLNSIYSLSYEPLELIVSDDCSLDDTVTICKNWLLTNSNRFVRTELITSEKNTGTSANCNRALKSAKGLWIKSLAGDDLLVPNAIDSLLNYCLTNEKFICFSRLEYFGDEKRIKEKRETYESFYNKYKSLERNEKYKLLLKRCVLPGASVFYSKKILEAINYIDESYPFYEEWPTFLRCFDAGYDIPYIPDRLVKYRCEQAGLSAAAVYDDTVKGRTYKVARRRVTDDESRFYYDYRRPRLMRLFAYYTVLCSDIKYMLYKIYSKPKLTIKDKIQIFLLKAIRPLTYKYAFAKLKHLIKK